jgi:hypothetical protein
MRSAVFLLAAFVFGAPALPVASPRAADTLVIEGPEWAGMSGFRAHWDAPIPLAADADRLQVDSVVKDRGQTAVWNAEQPAALSFDALHRSLLVRFPAAAEKIAAALAAGQRIEKLELVLPFLDDEIWPQGRTDFPAADGYRYRKNWNCDAYYRGTPRKKTLEQKPQLAYREERPTWHAVAHALRRPWAAGADHGPTFNAAIKGAVHWTRFGAADTATDRFPDRLGPAETSSRHPEGRIDVTAVVTDAAYGKSLGERLRGLSDCGFVVNKEETYDARYYDGPYEWTTATGGRAIVIGPPQLVVTLAAGPAAEVALPPAADVPALAAAHAGRPLGRPTAVAPGPAEVARLDAAFNARPDWMPEWHYAHVRQLFGLGRDGPPPFYYLAAPPHVTAEVIRAVRQKAGKGAEPPQADIDHAVYLSWLDWINGRQPRFWEGHLTAAEDAATWFAYRDALPEPVRESLCRQWTAWLMPDRESAATDKERKDFGDTSGRLIHPMADDPRVGSSGGRRAVFDQGDTYYKTTGDWRGNKSFFRSGFTQMASTANFNSTAVTGALLGGEMIGAERAIADGQSGLMRFPFWTWTWGGGVGQEYVDHYYWAIASAGNKLFADFAARPQDRAAGRSIIDKTANDLAISYHPGLKKLFGPASRTYYSHVLGEQDGLYHILHVLSRRGALSDVETGVLPDLTVSADMIAATTAVPPPAAGKPQRQAQAPAPMSAWGHDFPPAAVARASLGGPWADPWLTEWVDDKPLPFSTRVEKAGDLVTTWFGRDGGLTSVRQLPQRIHVLGHWRRRPEPPESMRDVGTFDIRVGFNQTQIGDDDAGVITRQGEYRIGQHENRLVLLARPRPQLIGKLAKEYPFGDPRNRYRGRLPPQEITSVQCSVALFNYSKPAPTWEIFVDDRRVESLPATAAADEWITIRDGVSYLAFRPLPTFDVGRDAAVTLEAGRPQVEAYHENVLIQPALFIHANFYRRAAPIPAADLERLAGTHAGFIVELGDESRDGSFAKFQARVRGARVAAGPDAAGGYAASYSSGAETLAVAWPAAADKGKPAPFSFTVDGVDPWAAFQAAALWQDTTLSQLGKGRRLEKAGAVVEREPVTGKNPMLVQVFPRQGVEVCTNPVPGWKAFRFTTSGGVRVVPDGKFSMGRIAVAKDGTLDVRHHGFELDPPFMPPATERATCLFVTGLKAEPRVVRDGVPLEHGVRPATIAGTRGWLVPLGERLPPEADIPARLAAVEALIAAP